MGLLQGILTALFPPQPEGLDEVTPGMVTTVRGTVVPRDLMDSPLTGDRCVYYQYTVEQWRQSQVIGVGGDGFWEITQRDEAILEFYLQDGDRRAIVCPHRSRVERGRGVRDVTLDVGQIGRRAQQLLICPGDLIEVTAQIERAQDIFDESRDYRSRADRLILQAPKDTPIVIRILGRMA